MTAKPAAKTQEKPKKKEPIPVVEKPNGCLWGMAVFLPLGLMAFLFFLGGSKTNLDMIAICLIYLSLLASGYIMAKGFGDG